MTSPTQIKEILNKMQQFHNEEYQRGLDTFNPNILNADEDKDKEIQTWSDNDFISYNVGVGTAGPDEFQMKNGHCVHQTIKPVFTKAECEALVSEAKAYIDSDLSSNNESNKNDEIGDKGSKAYDTTNSALGEAKVSTLPKALHWLQTNMRTKLFPLLESRFGLTDLTLNDALIIGYGYFNQSSSSQPIHRDASIVSLNIALSPLENYDEHGGGTYFEGISIGQGQSISEYKQIHREDDDNNHDPPTNNHSRQGPIKIDQGHVLCHSGGAMHAGNGIQSGQRWVLVLFCLSKSIPQLARRCDFEGMKLRMDGDLDGVGFYFETHVFHLFMTFTFR